MMSNCTDEIEPLITVASRQDATEIRIARRCLRQQDRPVRLVNEFSAQDRREPCVSCHIEKVNGSIEPVGIRESERVLTLCASRVAERLQCRHTLHGGVGRMRVQMNEGGRHSMTPPVSDRLLSEPSMERVERDGEALRSVVPLLFIMWPLVEEPDLLCIGHQTGHAHGHKAEPHPTTEAPLKERREHGSKIAFPTGIRDGALPLRDFNLIAVADRERQIATHPPLTAKRPTQSLQNIHEPTPQDRVIDFIRLKNFTIFETRLNGGWKHRYMVDPLCPS